MRKRKKGNIHKKRRQKNIPRFAEHTVVLDEIAVYLKEVISGIENIQGVSFRIIHIVTGETLARNMKI